MFNKMPQFGKSFLKWISRIMPEGMKGKSFIERGVTPMEERYIGNAKMFTEEEKRQLLNIYKKGFTIRILRSLFMRKAKGMIQLIACSILISIHGCAAIFY